MIPPSLLIGSIGIAGGMIGAVCASSALPGSHDSSQSGAPSALGTPGNGDGRVFGIPVRANSGPLITSAVVTAAPGDYVSKTDLGEPGPAPSRNSLLAHSLPCRSAPANTLLHLPRTLSEESVV